MDIRPYSIRYWPTWIGLGLLWCLSRLPYAWQTAIGRVLGNMFRRLAASRRQIAQVNFSLCFPELTDQQRRKLLADHFASLGIGIMETAMSWWATKKQLQKLVSIDGLQHLHDALQGGKGVILLSAHFTTLEIGGRLLALHAPFHVMYREHKNPVIERVMRNARTRNFDKAIQRKDLRTLLHSLKQNLPVWYAPDQDYGSKHSIFAPFFGVQAASITATSRIARMSGAAIVPFFQTRLPDNKGYRLTLYPALQDFPGENVEQDTRRINELVEAAIREQPEQYLWVHRRFKTRPPGEDKLYKPRRNR
ncbi:MAG: LpxL/LpxP family Kdo(2)-lipid IV(A) lauroyl/palmitoleoyl acyltransferase [Gammaproteobacteria bacterium]